MVQHAPAPSVVGWQIRSIHGWPAAHRFFPAHVRGLRPRRDRVLRPILPLDGTPAHHLVARRGRTHRPDEGAPRRRARHPPYGMRVHRARPSFRRGGRRAFGRSRRDAPRTGCGSISAWRAVARWRRETSPSSQSTRTAVLPPSRPPCENISSSSRTDIGRPQGATHDQPQRLDQPCRPIRHRQRAGDPLLRRCARLPAAATARLRHPRGVAFRGRRDDPPHRGAGDAGARSLRALRTVGGTRSGGRHGRSGTQRRWSGVRRAQGQRSARADR